MKKMIDPFDKLIEETKEKYRLSWEKSLEDFEKFCKNQDEDFKWAIKQGKFPLRITVKKIEIKAKTRTLNANYSLEVLPDKIKIKIPFQITMSKKLNFFENLYCGWLHIFWLFPLWQEIVFKTDGSQSSVFFDFIQYDYINVVEFTWWRGGKYKHF
jgi:hypothetical protein